jgi:hypothetical protein
VKKLLLTRDSASPTEVQGSLVFNGLSMHTIERPWIPTDPGGKPFQSCVPAGRYWLRPHTRRNGDEVLALVNPGLGVYYLDSDRQGVGRYLILIHVGNWSTDVVGCIAPGLGKSDSDKGPMVTSSRSAMTVLMDYIGGDAALIDIVWADNDLQGD